MVAKFVIIMGLSKIKAECNSFKFLFIEKGNCHFKVIIIRYSVMAASMDTS